VQKNFDTMADVNGLRVIVTGATKGIGKGIGIAYAKAGSSVLCVGRSEELGEVIVADLQKDGYKAFFIKADISLRQDCQKMADFANENFGGIDVIIANAGLMPKTLLEDITDNDFDEVFSTNVKGAVTSGTLMHNLLYCFACYCRCRCRFS
jgi:3-oxoacyl-[acyl-carrier protein] reductase